MLLILTELAIMKRLSTQVSSPLLFVFWHYSNQTKSRYNSIASLKAKIRTRSEVNTIELSQRQLRLSAKIHFWKNGNSNSNLEIKVTWTFGMLSMNWDAFDGIRKKIRGGDVQGHRRTLVGNGRLLQYQERIRLKKQAERREKRSGERKPVVKIRMLNGGSMTGRGHELVDLMERRKVKIMCLQETKWKGSNARELGNGFKLFYIGEDGKRNGVGIVLNDDLKKGVLEVRRPSDRIISLTVELGQQVVNIMSAFAPQAGCTDEEKEKFWGDLDEEMRKIPDGEKFWIGGDVNSRSRWQ